MNNRRNSKGMVKALRVLYKRRLRKFKAFMQLLESIDWALKEIRKNKPLLLEAEPCGGNPQLQQEICDGTQEKIPSII